MMPQPSQWIPVAACNGHGSSVCEHGSQQYSAAREPAATTITTNHRILAPTDPTFRLTSRSTAAKWRRRIWISGSAFIL